MIVEVLPQECGTAMKPISAPRCLGSVASLRSVSATARSRIACSGGGFPKSSNGLTTVAEEGKILLRYHDRACRQFVALPGAGHRRERAASCPGVHRCRREAAIKDEFETRWRAPQSDGGDLGFYIVSLR